MLFFVRAARHRSSGVVPLYLKGRGDPLTWKQSVMHQTHNRNPDTMNDIHSVQPHPESANTMKTQTQIKAGADGRGTRTATTQVGTKTALL